MSNAFTTALIPATTPANARPVNTPLNNPNATLDKVTLSVNLPKPPVNLPIIPVTPDAPCIPIKAPSILVNTLPIVLSLSNFDKLPIKDEIPTIAPAEPIFPKLELIFPTASTTLLAPSNSPLNISVVTLLVNIPLRFSFKVLNLPAMESIKTSFSLWAEPIIQPSLYSF